MASGILNPLEQIFLIEFNIEFFQHLKIFLLKAFLGVMLFLITGITNHAGQLRTRVMPLLRSCVFYLVFIAISITLLTELLTMRCHFLTDQRAPTFSGAPVVLYSFHGLNVLKINVSFTSDKLIIVCTNHAVEPLAPLNEHNRSLNRASTKPYHKIDG